MIIVFGCSRGCRTDTAGRSPWGRRGRSGDHGNPLPALCAEHPQVPQPARSGNLRDGPASPSAGTAFLYVLVKVVGGPFSHLATVNFLFTPATAPGELAVLSRPAAENDRWL